VIAIIFDFVAILPLLIRDILGFGSGIFKTNLARSHSGKNSVGFGHRCITYLRYQNYLLVKNIQQYSILINFTVHIFI